ncbi:hypothetical protein MKX07_004148 [Trichoderma sp. CBMAI-0711]|uniref:Mid2 domain-containing protein n=1 Tax=Trichoderma parareesei TaxID=858221 RepID=A0A2H2ZAP7_TRIPA|nr:hypothetical protein MKX07_004148 [Trichoderma sp. CBMAI-0711]OTA04269.1 hypothetical protein A9Z42_0048390 [Trichoderma parareesei]
MYSSRLVSVLVVVVSILCLVQANWWDVQKVHHRGLIRRADLSDVVGDLKKSTSADDSLPSPTPASETPSSTPAQQTTADDSSSSTSASPSSPSSTSESPSVTPTPGSTSSPASATADPTTSAPDSTTSAGPTPSATTPPATTTSSSGGGSDDSSSDQKTSAGGNGKGGSSPSETPSAVVSTKVEVVTMTNSDGSKTTQTTTTKTTHTAALNADNQKPTGMSTKTRNTIIGVVVGVGGAAILGALILVAFRVWGRKKHAEEADGLMAYNSDLVAGAEKSPRGSSSGAGQRNPFQSTLENYHQPVNASANF